MTQSEIITYFAAKTDLNRKQVKRLFEELASLARREVKVHEEFVFPGMGKLVSSQRKARQGRNPSTGEPIKISSKKTIKFQVSKSMTRAALGGDNTTDSDT